MRNLGNATAMGLSMFKSFVKLYQFGKVCLITLYLAELQTYPEVHLHPGSAVHEKDLIISNRSYARMSGRQ